MTSIFSLRVSARAGAPRPSTARRLAILAAGMLACLPGIGLWPARAAADDKFVAVIATDGYADLKQQIRWVGTLVGNPALDGFAESFIMMATQFKGLAGLDVDRPAGVVVTASGDTPVMHGCVPVKDLGKLLAALANVIGPAEERDGGWRISPPNGPVIDVVEKDGWAIFSQRGTEAGSLDPAVVFGPIVKSFSVGAQVFPSAMPAPMLATLQAIATQAATAAAEQGQPVDAAAIPALVAGLAETESLLLGLNIDTAKERIYLETRAVMTPGSTGATVWSDAGRTKLTFAAPPAANGKAAAVRGHHAQAVSAEGRAAVEQALATALPADASDPVSQAVFALLKDMAAAMLDAGGIDAGLVVDTSAAGSGRPIPAVTAGMRIKDGAALQQAVKKRLTADGVLPPNVTVKFDAGTADDATLHELTIDLTGLPNADKLGGRIVLTLAVTPDYAYLLAGEGVAERLAAMKGLAGKVDPALKPLTGVDVSLAALLAYVAEVQKDFMPDDPNNAIVAAVAKEAAERPTTLLQLLLRPIERGVAARISTDGGAIQTIAALVAASPAEAAGDGGPAIELKLQPGAAPGPIPPQ
jgi:hypothetical protein